MKLARETYSNILQNAIERFEDPSFWSDFEGITYKVESEKEMGKKRLFFDLDGVLAVWQDKLFNPITLPNGEILPIGTPVTDEIWNNPETHYYASIPPYPVFVDAINDFLCDRDDCEVFILSKSPYFAIKDKFDWVRKYLPNIPTDHIIICPYGKYPKTNFLDEISKDDYLFDDFSPNVREWNEAGGTPVNVVNGVNNNDPKFMNIYNNFSSEEVYEKYENDSLMKLDLYTEFEKILKQNNRELENEYEEER